MFWCSDFGVCVWRREFVLSCSKITIVSFVCIGYIGDGDMEESSKCACEVVICIV